MLYLFFEVAYVHLLLGEVAAYEAWSTFLFEFRGLALLPALLWALRYAESPTGGRSTRLLAPALRAAAARRQPHAASRSSDGVAGPYHAGLYDLPWTLPFVWIGLVAAALSSGRSRRRSGRRARAATGQSARRATVLAFVAVLLFPVVHILLAWADAAALGGRCGCAPRRRSREPWW